MEASPVPYYYRNQVPPHQRQPRPPQFGGMGYVATAAGAAFASGAGLIDRSRIAELVTTDLCGMILPRTALAYTERGMDDGRETFLRELSGLIGNALLVGWVSQLMVKGLGNSVNRYNPLGIPGKAWISSENLQIFGDLYEDALKNSDTAQMARERFIRNVLGRLESGDRQLSIESRVASLQQLSGDAQQQMLEHMVETIGDTANLKTYQSLLTNPEELKKKFLKNDWGRLSPQSQDELYQYFKQKGDKETSVKGTHNFDARAMQRVQEVLPHGTEAEKRQAFLKYRLAFSLDDLRNEAQEFEKAVSEDALARGLTGTIDLRDVSGKAGKEYLSKNQNRGVYLKQLKFFLEHFVDRANYKASGGNRKEASKDEIRRWLKRDSQQGLPVLNKIIPHAKDGLITAANKSKFAYTWIPMTVALLASGVFTFYNNYITKKKYGGKVFFPGEGLPVQEPVATPKALPGGGDTSHNHFAASRPMQPTFRNSAVGYVGYPAPYGQVPRIQRGVIA